MVITHLLLNRLVEAHLWERCARIFHLTVKWWLVCRNLWQRILVRLIQTLHLDVRVLNRLFIGIAMSFFAHLRRVFIVILVEMHREGRILLGLLLDQLEVVVSEGTLRACRSFPAETTTCKAADFLVFCR